MLRTASDRTQAEAALRDSEVRFRAIFEHAAIGIGLVDMQGRTIEANPALTTMLGYSADELHECPLLPSPTRMTWIVTWRCLAS